MQTRRMKGQKLLNTSPTGLQISPSYFTVPNSSLSITLTPLKGHRDKLASNASTLDLLQKIVNLLKAIRKYVRAIEGDILKYYASFTTLFHVFEVHFLYFHHHLTISAII